MAGACVQGLQLPDGDPGAVQDAAVALRRCGGGFESAGGTAANAAASVPGWNGLASFAFQARCGDYRSAAHAAGAVCHQAASALARYGHELQEARQHVQRLQRRGQDCVERINAAQRAARLAGEREVAARRRAYQADFLAGADGGILRASAEHDAGEAAADRTRAEREEKRERGELRRLQREAERTRERVKEAGRAPPPRSARWPSTCPRSATPARR